MIHKTIKELRKKEGWSQKELAEKLKVSESAVSMWERGQRTLDIERSVEIANLFDVTLTYLVTGKESDINQTSPKEELLLEAWRHSDDQTRRIVAYALGISNTMQQK
jgi:transcriptional regulator with XRE-family HTH domain